MCEELDIDFIIKIIIERKILPSEMAKKDISLDRDIKLYHPYVLRNTGEQPSIWYVWYEKPKSSCKCGGQCS
jgi:hypothetical protein